MAAALLDSTENTCTTADSSDASFSPSQSDLVANIWMERWPDVCSILSSASFIQQVKTESFSEPTPLHVACSIPSVPLEVVKGILDVYGDNCCLIEDDDGNLPIHIACSTQNLDIRVIQLLLTASPETSFVREEGDGEVPLFLLLRQDNGVSAFLYTLKVLPKQCFLRENGNSLLHEACETLLPNTILNTVLDVYPEIPMLRNQRGDTIAHIICSHKDSTPPMVEALQRRCPSSFALQDADGNLPLHVVNSEKHSEKIIQILLEIYPKGIMVFNKEMQTPFSSKLIRNSPEKMKAILINGNPAFARSVLTSRNARGMLILEELFYLIQQRLSSMCHSSQMETTPSVLQELQLNSPLLKDEIESLFILMNSLYYNITEWPKCHGNTNFVFYHDVAFWLSLPLLTKLFLNQHPEIAFQKDSNGNFPLHVVAKYGARVSSANSKCSLCGGGSHSPLYFWVNKDHQRCTQCQSRYKKGEGYHQVPLLGCHVHSTFQHLLEINPDASRAVDSNGSLPLHLSLNAGKSWYSDGVRELFEAAPDSLLARDNDGLTPVIIASSNGRCDLTTIFELLRNDPHVTS